MSEGGDASATNAHVSDVQVEGPHEQIQIADVGGLEEFWLIQHGQSYSQSGPDVPRHHLLALLPAPALPLKT